MCVSGELQDAKDMIKMLLWVMSPHFPCNAPAVLQRRKGEVAEEKVLMQLPWGQALALLLNLSPPSSLHGGHKRISVST